MDIEKQSEEDSTEQFSSIARNIQHGVVWINQKGKLLYQNEQFAKDLGYKEGTAMPSTIFEVNPLLNLLLWRETWKELCFKGEIELETQHINVDGVIHPVIINGLLIDTGAEKICFGFVEFNRASGKVRQLLELTSSITHAGSWQYDIVKNDWIFTDELFKLLHLKKEKGQKSLTDLLQPIMNPAEYAVLTEQFEVAKDTGAPISVEFSIPSLTKDKSNHLRLTAVSEKGAEDTFSIYGIIQDISKSNGRTVEKHLAQYSVDYGHEAMAWLNTEGDLVYMNRSYLELTGYSADEQVELTIFDVNRTLGKDEWNVLWKKMRSSKKSIIETFHFTKEDDKIPVEVYSNHLVFEGKEYVCLFVRDLRARKQKTRPQRLAQFTLDNNPLMVLWIDKSGQVIYANKSACEQLEYENLEIRGKNITEISDSYPDVRMWNARWRIMKEEEGNAYEEVNMTKSGRKFPVEVTRHYIEYEEEEFICVFLKDITERKIRESEIKGNLSDSLNQSASLSKEIAGLRDEMKTKGSLSSIVTNSNVYMKVLTEIRRVAETDATVLITGETGTGKELLAKAVHELSERSEKTFIKVNAAVIPENLFESELFGHEKGSFTGAFQDRKGRFEAADKGTIFLDEIGEMAFGLQAKLLRVLQEGEFERVGGSRTIKVDVRVVAATNRNLEQMVTDGKFREDLYYRLNVFPIHNLPLRDRLEDVPFLVRFFLKKYTRKIGKKVTEVSTSDLKALMKYSFPGNVRELENMVERALILSSDGKLNLSAVLKSEKSKGKK